MTTLKATLQKKIDDKTPKMIEMRRYLHQHPELSFEEEKTSQFIVDFYKGKDCDVKTNVGGYGVVVTIDSGKPGKTIALRADFDALPITEETGLEFTSKNPGCMHACGHDAHTSYMLTLADTLLEIKDQLVGKVVILHQPAEETPPGGAIAMIKDGCLEGVDNVLGVHLWSPIDTGDIHYCLGATMAGRSSFKVKFKGKGGHGAVPHEANDTIVAASQFVVAAQTIVSRRVSPFEMATLTIGNFDGRGSFNVIKDSVFIEGDVRSMDPATRELVAKEFKSILDGIAAMFRIEYELFYEHDYPVLMSDEALTSNVIHSIETAGIENLNEISLAQANPASEDFAYYSEVVPSSYIFVGAKPASGEFFPHHHPKFDINEDAMGIAAKAIGTATLDYLLG